MYRTLIYWRWRDVCFNHCCTLSVVHSAEHNATDPHLLPPLTLIYTLCVPTQHIFRSAFYASQSSGLFDDMPHCRLAIFAGKSWNATASVKMAGAFDRFCIKMILFSGMICMEITPVCEEGDNIGMRVFFEIFTFAVSMVSPTSNFWAKVWHTFGVILLEFVEWSISRICRTFRNPNAFSCTICLALWCLILWLSFTYGTHSIYARLFLPGYGQDIPVHFSAYLSRSEHEPITNRSENGHNNTSHSGTKTVTFTSAKNTERAWVG